MTISQHSNSLQEKFYYDIPQVRVLKYHAQKLLSHSCPKKVYLTSLYAIKIIVRKEETNYLENEITILKKLSALEQWDNRLISPLLARFWLNERHALVFPLYKGDLEKVVSK